MTRYAFALALAAVVAAGIARADEPRWTLPQSLSLAVGHSAPIYAKCGND
jgi:hypothetical protein